MTVAFVIMATIVLAGAIGAMACRNLVHCALSLIVTFAGLACLYLQLHAEFVAFVQVLVYIGAVAILIVFAILLTRSSTRDAHVPVASATWLTGVVVTLLVFGTLVFAISRSNLAQRTALPAGESTTKEIGEQLMTHYVLPLEVIALLLTAAMIGAVVIAMKDRHPPANGAAGSREAQIPDTK